MFAFDNTYARLPDRFFARIDPDPAPAPKLLKLNEELARDLGLDPDALRGPAGVAALAGNDVPEGAEPLAMAYAGHQFGGFVPQLGDGRALLLGEVTTPAGERFDVQLKGSGPTPFSRGGDGRAWMGPVLREYLVSEAMFRLGVPTTRALAAVATGAPVLRETALPGAVLTRVARSHVRVGTFQFFAARGDTEGVRALADYVLDRHGPDADDDGSRYRALLDAVIARQCELVARWMGVGFIHGVMNTDNTSIAGETIDYGPCAFVDDYHPGAVFSSIDRRGRYAFANQPGIARWNIARFAETLLPLLGDDDDAAVAHAEEALATFAPRFEAAFLERFRPKIGLEQERDGDNLLVAGLLDAMAETRADFTNTFRAVADALDGDDEGLRAALGDGGAGWIERWRARLAQEPGDAAQRAATARAASPAVIPRNHLVEAALTTAVDGDLTRFDELERALRAPFDETEDNARFRLPPEPHQVVKATFCGT